MYVFYMVTFRGNKFIFICIYKFIIKKTHMYICINYLR
jgi:hypothetical protein